MPRGRFGEVAGGARGRFGEVAGGVRGRFGEGAGGVRGRYVGLSIPGKIEFIFAKAAARSTQQTPKPYMLNPKP
eukprot:365985-Chlamydomonas_euryale.AAC.5